MKVMSRKTALIVSICLAVLLVVAATFAWFTSNDSVTNHLETAMITDGTVTVVEHFEEPPDWKPGQEVTKEVAVSNNGEGGVLARVSFEEVLSMLKMPALSSDSPLAADQIPQSFNATTYLDTAAGWSDPTGAGLTLNGTLPAGVELRVSKAESDVSAPASPSTPSTPTTVTYNITPLYKISGGEYDGTYQRVTGDFSVKNGEISFANIKYWYYSGRTTAEGAWADFEDPKTSASVTTPTKDEIIHPVTDPSNPKMILLNYAEQTDLTASDPVAGKWWYNEADGFFYYIGKIEGGTISPMLLQSLKLDESADSAYAGMEFDLIVNMEAIQNTEAAITATDGWGLSSQQALLDALKPFCDD